LFTTGCPGIHWTLSRSDQNAITKHLRGLDEPVALVKKLQDALTDMDISVVGGEFEPLAWLGERNRQHLADPRRRAICAAQDSQARMPGAIADDVRALMEDGPGAGRDRE
jgi:hypothetical protein